ncbi:DUF6975 family protein [Sphingomicrobium sediminis]|uniref:Uncharacterized protein n=1 Tax=Sphingomicrobium sediminis TaxID=2950949 RepID=A0A9X2EF71_9SPHN|nr:hypothetical protein [Sphingomicrobium sediminis]MCM8556858.1 hypothetical protein [Sphingomicrobium sediminis]
MVAGARKWQETGNAGLAPYDRVATEGIASHPHAMAIAAASSPEPVRDLADLIHLICDIHGRHPTLVEAALARSASGVQRDWMMQAANAFERERLYVVDLTARVGPLPSTPGAAASTSTMQATRHAVETLAKSERRGCALGAATALVVDWQGIRALLDIAAERVGIDLPECTLPDRCSTEAVMASVDGDVAAERALGFGAEQLLLQHRGLFDLLEARAKARYDADC